MKKRRVWLVAVALLLIGLGWWGKQLIQKQPEPKREERVNTEEQRMLASGYAVEGDHYFVMNELGMSPLSIPSRYVVEVNNQFRSQTLGEREDGHYVRQRQTDWLLLDIYEIGEKEKWKTIDVKAILDQQYPDLQLAVRSVGEIAYQGAPCVMMLLENYPEQYEDGLADTQQRAYLNLETEELILEPCSWEEWEKNGLRAPLSLPKDFLIYDDLDYNLLQFNGIDGSVTSSRSWEGLYGVTVSVDSLPEKNERLYGMFPQLKETAERVKEEAGKGARIRVTIAVVDEEMTPESLIKLVMEEGQEISFAGMKISRSNSVDRMEHEVSSFAEYEQYCVLPERPVDGIVLPPIFPRK